LRNREYGKLAAASEKQPAASAAAKMHNGTKKEKDKQLEELSW